MSYFSVVSFDLKNADSEDYKNAYTDLEKIGFSRSVLGSKNKKTILPTTVI